MKYEACSREVIMESSMMLGNFSASHLIKAATCFFQGESSEMLKSGKLKEEKESMQLFVY